MDKDKVNKKIPGTGRGTGRRLGSKNVLAGEVKKDIATFFKGLTVESLKWRTNVAHHLLDAPSQPEFRFSSKIALEYGFGTPAKMEPEGKQQRDPRVFVTLNGLLPWDERANPMKAKKDAMIKAKEDDERLLALEAKKPAVGATIDTKDSEVAEELVSVNLPEAPELFNPGGRR